MSEEPPDSQQGQPPNNPPATVQPPLGGADGPPHSSAHVHAHHPATHLRFLEQLKHRNVIRVAILYLVACWLILDPVHVVFHMLEVPSWANRLVVILMVIGFPVVLLFAWVYEITPEGLKPTAEVEPQRSIRKLTARRLDRAIMIVLLLGIAYLLVDKFWLSKHVAATERETRAPSSATTPAAFMAAEKSIAVLPFADMSEKRDQEYFADGMAEEVLDLLAKVPELKVIGRTSSFQFKGKSDDLRSIGATLGAAYIVEGSVRKAGSRIRVTAQLIDTRSGTHRWSDSYDRDFGDVLMLQEEIATGIARALQLAVNADDTGPLRPLANPEAYTLYLRGRVAQDQQHLPQLVEAVRDFEQALALEPSFLRAAEALALAHVAQGFDEDVVSHDAWQRARAAAERALRIEPNSATAHAVLGLVHAEDEFNWDAAETEFSKALLLNPRESVALYYAALVAHIRGNPQEAERLMAASLALDPLDPYAQQQLGQMLLASGDFTGAAVAFRKSLAINATFDGNHYHLGRMLLTGGQSAEALKEMQAEVTSDAKDAGLAMVYHAMGRKADSDAALARLIRASGDTWPYSVATVYAYRGEKDEALKWLEKGYVTRDSDQLGGVRGDPEFVGLRGDPRYKALLRKMNLPE